MNILKRGLPTAIAVIAGLATLAGLLVFPDLSTLLLEWAAFLAAVALVAGILNLLAIHLRRTAGRNIYSLVLIWGCCWSLATVTDALGLTEDGVGTVFNTVQVPLEAALASLLAFFCSSAASASGSASVAAGHSSLLAILFPRQPEPLPTSVEELSQPRTFVYLRCPGHPGVQGLLLGISWASSPSACGCSPISNGLARIPCSVITATKICRQ